MVAYSFQPRFVGPIIEGTKAQTIRAVGRRRHAQPGDQLQLYTGMRTRRCRLIGRATCTSLWPISISLAANSIALGDEPVLDLDSFARQDGFAGWRSMRLFWQDTHGKALAEPWHGFVVSWADLVPA